MSLEAVLLILVAFFVVFGVATKPGSTFRQSGPRLGARLEAELSVGSEFKVGSQHQSNRWQTPQGAEPTGSFK